MILIERIGPALVKSRSPLFPFEPIKSSKNSIKPQATDPPFDLPYNTSSNSFPA